MNVIEELKSRDLQEYIEEITNQHSYPVGSGTYRFDSCPICGSGTKFKRVI